MFQRALAASLLLACTVPTMAFTTAPLRRMLPSGQQLLRTAASTTSSRALPAQRSFTSMRLVPNVSRGQHLQKVAVLGLGGVAGFWGSRDGAR
jgi:hypothetical protein